MKSYVVIGLGRFGAEMALQLYSHGEDVLAIDTDEIIVDKIADRVTKAVAADARDIDVLRKLGVGNFDRAVVAQKSTDLAGDFRYGIGGKAYVVPRVEPSDRLQKTDGTELTKIFRFQPAALISLCDRRNKREIILEKLVFGVRIAVLRTFQQGGKGVPVSRHDGCAFAS